METFSQLKAIPKLGVVAHAFNPSTWEAEADQFEFEASLVYRVSSRKARAIQRNPVLKQTNKQTNKKQNKKPKQTNKKNCLTWTCKKSYPLSHSPGL